MNNKKGAGALQFLTAGVILVLIAVLTVAIGIQVNSSMTDSFKGDATAASGESLGDYVNGTTVALTHPLLASVDAVWVYNTSSNVNQTLTTTGNYTVSIPNGTITFLGTGPYAYENNESWANYTYYPRTTGYNASTAGTTGMSAFADYWVSIVSVIILVVIVGLFAYFRGGAGVDLR